jgi:hypothetical protein
MSTPTTPQRPLCFVIGPIGKDRTDVRKHADLLLHAVIKHVLEATEFGYFVKRADQDADPGMIGDRVLADILHAELVVADLTDLNANAFYELGIRHATEKPTIHLARAGTLLPFDNIHHRTIFVDLSDWHSIESGRSQLSKSAHAIKAPGYQGSNPITQANASFKMRESADPRDRVIATLQERLISIEAQLSNVPSSGNQSDRTTQQRQVTNNSRGLLLIDTTPILEEKGEVIKIEYTEYRSIGSLLDFIFHILHSADDRIGAYRYNIQWVLEDQRGEIISSQRTRDTDDFRSLATAGIRPDTLLRVKPTQPNWALL